MVKAAFNKEAFNGVALVLIDVERKYCDPAAQEFGTEKSEKIAERIGDLTRAFQAAGQRVFFVHMNDNPQFHHVSPTENDIVFHKKTYSAWATLFDDPKQHIDDILRQNNITHPIFVGFNSSRCLKLTTMDAQLYGFQSSVIEELCGYGNPYTQDDHVGAMNALERRGVKVEKLDSICRRFGLKI